MSHNLAKKLIRRLTIKLRSSENSRYRFFDVGFHGDEYLLRLVDTLLQRSSFFIETGANVGSTLAYVARTFPQIMCMSCEPDERAFAHASNNTRKYPNVAVYNLTSQDFLERLSLEPEELFESSTLFWLDAHGYGFKWPLKEELSFITTNFNGGYILIDDFKVPGQDQFSYHRFKGQVCSFDFIEEALNPNMQLRLYYPDYTKKTSKHHPLTGWGLIIFGNVIGLESTDYLELKIKNG